MCVMCMFFFNDTATTEIYTYLHTLALHDALPISSAITHAKGTGTVTAIDSAAGKITLDHGPIAELQWPAMTMAFDAPPALLTAVKIGDQVSFDLDWDGTGGTITAFTPAD